MRDLMPDEVALLGLGDTLSLLPAEFKTAAIEATIGELASLGTATSRTCPGHQGVDGS